MHRTQSFRAALIFAAVTLLATTAWADEPTAVRRQREHAALREKLTASWSGPINDGLRKELRRHAGLVARLHRVKAIANGENDNVSAERATKLLMKENDRHERWLTDNIAKESQ